MSSLVEISNDLVAFRSLLDETDGELSPETETALDLWFAEIGVARDAKLDNYCALLENLALRIGARKEAEARLAKRRRVDENIVENLKERLRYFFQIQSIKSIETERYKLSLCQNGGKQPFIMECPPEKLPPIYQRLTIEADADLIRETLSAGREVPGCKLEPRGSHLRIS